MLTAAFVGWAIGAAAVAMLPAGRSADRHFGITVPLLIGLGAALLSGMLLALSCVGVDYVRADQIISGVIINIAAIGLTGYLNSLISGASPTGAGNFTALHVPGLTNMPLIGWLIGAILDQGPIALSAIVLVFVLQILLFRTSWGLRTRAVGEHPRAAETVGIDVIRLRYRNVIAPARSPRWPVPTFRWS